MTVLKILAGLVAVCLVVIALFAVIGGVLGFIQRARLGPTSSPRGRSRRVPEDPHDNSVN